MDDSPLERWQQMRAVDGERVTVIDLYQLVAAPRGINAWELSREERYELACQAMPSIWSGWTTTDGSDREDVLTVTEYDETWPEQFAAWRHRIIDALGETAERIEHVGSTSVLGLLAKPIIDIQVSVADLADEERFVPQLEAAGVQLRSRDDLHCYFRPFAGAARDVHVHVCPSGSQWERDHLQFRDYLRRDPDACAAYADAKRLAISRWADDGIAYTEAKTAVIFDIMARAA